MLMWFPVTTVHFLSARAGNAQPGSVEPHPFNRGPESQIDLLSDLRTCPTRIAPLHLDTGPGLDALSGLSAPVSLSASLKTAAVLSSLHRATEIQQRGRLECDSHSPKLIIRNPKRTESSN